MTKPQYQKEIAGRKLARMQEHEEHRWETMTVDALTRRIRKMTKLDKISLFIQEARERGEDTLARMGIAQQRWVRENL